MYILYCKTVWFHFNSSYKAGKMLFQLRMPDDFVQPVTQTISLREYLGIWTSGRLWTHGENVLYCKFSVEETI